MRDAFEIRFAIKGFDGYFFRRVPDFLFALPVLQCCVAVLAVLQAEGGIIRNHAVFPGGEFRKVFSQLEGAGLCDPPFALQIMKVRPGFVDQLHGQVLKRMRAPGRVHNMAQAGFFRKHHIGLQQALFLNHKAVGPGHHGGR